jgi:L-lactate utilization protein LutC
VEQDLVASFIREVEQVHGRAVRARGSEEALKVVVDTIRGVGARVVARTGLNEIDQEALDRALEAEGIRVVATDRGATVSAIAKADVGVTGADFGIADTGTLGIFTRREIDRLVSSLPFTHIALLPQDRLIPSLHKAEGLLQGEATQALKEGRGFTLSLITGPSSTGDIELNIVYGVHGPNDLRVVIIG